MLFFCALLLCALIFSPFLLTVSMIGLLLVAFINTEVKDGTTSWSFNTAPFLKLKEYKKYLPFLVIPLYFLIVLFSFWQNTGASDYFVERLRIKLPFLILPFVFLGLPPFSKKEINGLLYFLLILLVLTCIGIGVNYLLNFEAINDMLSRGKPMPTPRNHIRFSLLTATGIIGGIYLISQKYFWKYNWERYLISACTLFLILFIHILSVKSGLLCLYFALGILALRYIFKSGNIFIGIGLIAGILLIPFIAYKTIPSLKSKIDYTLWDLGKYREGAGGGYGDAGRITSLKVGVELFQTNPVFGVGVGNIRSKVDQIYAEKYPDYTQPIMPHSQFLYVLAAMGIVGLLLFLIAFFVPLFYNRAYHDLFFLGFYMIFLMAFLLEHTIENQLGVASFSFFLLLFLNKQLLTEEG